MAVFFAPKHTRLDEITKNKLKLTLESPVKKELYIVGNLPNVDTIFRCDASSVTIPVMFINGDRVSGTNETSDGSSIVFALPKAQTVSAPNGSGGHIVAPQADVTIGGGFFNGCVVANSLNAAAEGHMFPYNGTVIEDDKEDESESESESESTTESESESESTTETESESESTTESESESESTTETESEPESTTETESESESTTESGSESGSESSSQPTVEESTPATTPSTEASESESALQESESSEESFSGEAVNGAVNEISDGMGGVLGLMRGVLGERVRTGDESMTFAVIYMILIAIAAGCISFVTVKRRKTK